MDARKMAIVTGAALAGAGLLASRSVRARMHESCRNAWAGRCGGADDTEEPVERKCSPPAACHPARAA